MIYEVRRTSVDDNTKPCKGVMALYTVRYSERTPIWAIELDTLDDLMKFIRYVRCSVIIYEDKDEGEYPILEIYDDYRE